MEFKNKQFTFEKTILDAIQQKESEFGCRIGLSYRDKDLSLSVEYRDRELFHAASTMKVPVMIEVFRQAEQGRFAMSDSILVDPVFHSIIDDSTFDCEGAAYLQSRIGQPETILKLTELMIDVSDNLATNLLITLCDPKKITATAKSLGADQTQVLRCVMDIPAFEAGLSNRITAHDLTLLLEAIDRDRAASPSACSEMRRILLAQEYNDMIPARLPEEAKVAHKTGSIDGVQHDAGIVYAPFGTFYLAILSDELKENQNGIDAIADLARLIYDERAKF